MIKVENNIPTREPIPDFLDQSGTPEAIAALADLSWTDPSLGVQNAAWWSEENADAPLGTNKKWGAEVLTLDPERKVVIVTHKQVNMTAAEKAERDAAIQAATTAAFEQAVQTKLDGAARDAGYDSIFTAISYADEPAVPRFQADGQAFRRWRSLVWDYAHSELNAVLAGEKPQPDLDTFLAGLPALELPS
ncbi:hypothetical protein [Pseudomonas sp. RC10]|uniref:hypothetical protein n=1 Tax=Pseudomonas bambusae TaxID=3139142 RepID=UPI0031390C28